MPELKLNSFDTSSFVADYAWGAHYAAKTHKTRPFTEIAVSEYPIEQRFAELMAQTGSIEQSFTTIAIELGDRFKDVIDNHDWGIQGANIKRFKKSPTWKTITDSGALRESQSVEVSRL